MSAAQNQINLASLFKSVAGSLASQKDTLNNADTVNHDHGDNMVEVFNVISQAMAAKKGADPADQLEYASQLLRQKKSGSAQVYAQGLQQASKDFAGKKNVTMDNALDLVQDLLGGGQAPGAAAQGGAGGMADLLGSLMGGMGGAQTQQPQAPQSQAGGGMGDLLGSLLSGMGGAQAQQPQGQQAQAGDGMGDLLGSLLGAAGGTQPQQPQAQQGGGLDAGDLLNAGMAFMNTKQQGGSTVQALVNAVVQGSAMAGTPHRAQSGGLVVNSILQALGGMMGKQ